MGKDERGKSGAGSAFARMLRQEDLDKAAAAFERVLRKIVPPRKARRRRKDEPPEPKRD